MSERTDKRVALVTGATSGIGRGLAERLLREGWLVVSASRGPVDAAPPGATHVRADMAVAEEVAAIGEVIEQRFGRVDLVVCNSGTGPQIPHSDLTGATPEVWRHILEVNLIGTWRVIVATEPLLRRSSSAHVVTISSVAAITVRGSSVPYSVSKAGVVQLTKLLAKALAPAIRVNSIAPGWIETPRNATWPGREHMRDEVVPLRRLGQPSDIADAVLGLEMMHYVTGELVCVDGGIHLG